MTTFRHSTSGVCELVDRPSECPECHVTITPNFKVHVEHAHSSKIFVFFTCPNPSCGIAFSTEYTRYDQRKYKLKRVVSEKPKEPTFHLDLFDISSDFIKIYTQSTIAEALGLTEICGAGYRKALEFLIKDFLILQNPSNAEEIKKAMLGSCIEKFIDDTKLKTAAKRAAWLGNDETHYERIWIEKDVQDLKKLIDLTSHWVQMEHLHKQLLVEMPDKKP